jgi:hypothetical protein
MQKELIARLFVYSAAGFFAGSALLFFIQTIGFLLDSVFPLNILGWSLIAIVWGNAAFVLVRRFVAGVIGSSWHSWPFLITLISPPVVFFAIRPQAVGPFVPYLFPVVTILSVAVGHYFGKKAGDKRRDGIVK